MIILRLSVHCGVVIFSTLCHLVVSLTLVISLPCQDQQLESRGYDYFHERAESLVVADKKFNISFSLNRIIKSEHKNIPCKEFQQRPAAKPY